MKQSREQSELFADVLNTFHSIVTPCEDDNKVKNNILGVYVSLTVNDRE